MFSGKKALLLDMNSTFMFGEDNFSETEDFSIHYHQMGGVLERQEINSLIREVYNYLQARYPSERYRHDFPGVAETICKIDTFKLTDNEIGKVVDTFSIHECGFIPRKYVETLFRLNKKFQLALIIDIWSPKSLWLNVFEFAGISHLFSAMSFSSDHRMVKPSPRPFEIILEQLGINKEDGLVVGDSIRRDLGGASAAGIDCVLVGGATHADAMACYQDLLVFADVIESGCKSLSQQ